MGTGFAKITDKAMKCGRFVVDAKLVNLCDPAHEPYN